MLGLEPLYLACEGTMVIIASGEQAEKIVETLHQCPYSQNAAIIGTITEENPGKVIRMTEIGPSPSSHSREESCCHGSVKPVPKCGEMKHERN